MSNISNKIRNDKVIDLFLDRLPLKPRCADDYAKGQLIRSRDQAIEFKHVQPNTPYVCGIISFDLDFWGAATYWRDAVMPQPNFVCENPNGTSHAHIAYLLKKPVYMKGNVSKKAISYLNGIVMGMKRRLNADQNYSGTLMKNPLHPHWHTAWLRDEGYTLDELYDWLLPEDLVRQPIPDLEDKFGRNCALHDDLIKVAMREVKHFKRSGKSIDKFHEYVKQSAVEMNGFDDPLSNSEMRGIIKSVTKNAWEQFSEEILSQIQRARVSKRWRGNVSQETKAKALGISLSTFKRKMKAGLISEM